MKKPTDHTPQNIPVKTANTEAIYRTYFQAVTLQLNQQHDRINSLIGSKTALIEILENIISQISISQNFKLGVLTAISAIVTLINYE